MIKAKLLLELLVAGLYPIPFMVESSEVNGCEMLRHIAEKITQLMAALIQSTALYHQPDLFVLRPLLPPLCGLDSHGDNFHHKRFVLRGMPQFKLLPGVLRNGFAYR